MSAILHVSLITHTEDGATITRVWESDEAETAGVLALLDHRPPDAHMISGEGDIQTSDNVVYMEESDR
jgi:hypothetical protein